MTRREALRLAPVCAVLSLALPWGARADSAIACHCYRERAFDPAAPAAADGYVLATTRSSLVSAALGPSKASLVAAAMSGAAPDDLLVAHWTAMKAGGSASELLAARRARGSWKAALGSVAAKDVGVPFAEAGARDAPAADLAAIAIDELLVHRLGAEPAVVRELHAKGATGDEAIAAVVLAAARRTSALSALARVKAGAATWGGLFHEAGVEADAIDGVVRSLVR